MGWRDRDYARFSDEEHSLLYGAGGTARHETTATVHGFGIVKGASLATVVSAALFALGHFPAGHPILPFPAVKLHTSAKAPTPRRLPLDLGATTVAVGSGVAIDGTLPGREGRSVSLQGSLDGGPWQTYAATTIHAERFHLSLRYMQAGQLSLRLFYPNGDVAEGTVTVR